MFTILGRWGLGRDATKPSYFGERADYLVIFSKAEGSMPDARGLSTMPATRTGGHAILKICLVSIVYSGLLQIRALRLGKVLG